MENQVMTLTVNCVKAIENNYFLKNDSWVCEVFSAHQCKNNCQTSLTLERLFKVDPKSPLFFIFVDGDIVI